MRSVFQLLISTGLAFAASQTFVVDFAHGDVDVCNTPEIVSLQRPATATQNFTYKFRYLHGAAAGLPTVIRLPGGPGQSSIDQDDPRTSHDYDYIQTDPRGAGCNAALWSVTDAEATTDLIAGDIVAIVQMQHLEHVILFGTSFGSALATVVAHKLEALGHAPMALVLQGVVGRAFQDGESNTGFKNEWPIQSAALDAKIAATFASTLPYGYTARQWGQFISSILEYGRDPDNGEFFVSEYLNALNTQPAFIKQVVDAANETPPGDLIKVYQHVGCREFVAGWSTDTYLVQGKLVERAIPTDICAGLPLTLPFNSANFPSHARIYYFNGSDDPATPPWQAALHFNSQPQAERVVVSVPGGGHNSLSVNLSDCAGPLWADIVSGKTDLQATLASCKLHPTVKVVAAAKPTSQRLTSHRKGARQPHAR